MKKIRYIFTLLSIAALCSCQTVINAPDNYLNQVLAEAANCNKDNLKITDSKYEYPSTIYTINCSGKIAKCREQRYGYDLYSGNLSSQMICIPVN